LLARWTTAPLAFAFQNIHPALQPPPSHFSLDPEIAVGTATLKSNFWEPGIARSGQSLTGNSVSYLCQIIIIALLIKKI